MLNRSFLATCVIAALTTNAFAEAVAPAHAVPAATAHTAPAEAPKPADESAHIKLPDALATIEKAGAIKVIKEFPAENNMTGYIIRQTNSGQYAAVVASNNYVYIGAMLNSQGENLLPEYLAKYAPATDYTPIVDQIEKAGGIITWGKAGAPVAYVFADMNCVFCHKAIEDAKPYVAAGRLQLRIVPVAFLKPTSEGRAAAILQSKDPVNAMLENENGFVESKEEGGIPVVEATDATKKALAAHADSMRQAGFNGTPAFIYKLKDGKWYGTMMNGQTLNNIIAGTR